MFVPLVENKRSHACFQSIIVDDDDDDEERWIRVSRKRNAGKTKREPSKREKRDRIK